MSLITRQHSSQQQSAFSSHGRLSDLVEQLENAAHRAVHASSTPSQMFAQLKAAYEQGSVLERRTAFDQLHALANQAGKQNIDHGVQDVLATFLQTFAHNRISQGFAELQEAHQAGRTLPQRQAYLEDLAKTYSMRLPVLSPPVPPRPDPSLAQAQRAPLRDAASAQQNLHRPTGASPVPSRPASLSPRVERAPLSTAARAQQGTPPASHHSPPGTPNEAKLAQARVPKQRRVSVPQLTGPERSRAQVDYWCLQFENLRDLGGLPGLPASLQLAQRKDVRDLVRAFYGASMTPKARLYVLTHMHRLLAAGGLSPRTQKTLQESLLDHRALQFGTLMARYNSLVATNRMTPAARNHLVGNVREFLLLPELPGDWVGEGEQFVAHLQGLRLDGSGGPLMMRLPDTPALRQIMETAPHLFEATYKQNLGARVTDPQMGFTTNVSVLRCRQGPIFMASTQGQGTFSKFKPVLLADGRVMGARMLRTAEKERTKAVSQRKRNTVASHPELFYDELNALAAGNSLLQPEAHFVDQQGRIYQIVPMATGDASELKNVLTVAQRLEALPSLLSDSLKNLVDLERAGYLHRDIKTENIVFHEDGTFSLADYGLAHKMNLDAGVRGTRATMAPETFLPPASVEKSDVYSLGLTLLDFVRPSVISASGRPEAAPFALALPGGSHADAAAAARDIQRIYRSWQGARARGLPRPYPAAEEQVEQAHEMVARQSPALADLIFRRMLNPEPSRRFTAAELQQALASALPKTEATRKQQMRRLVGTAVEDMERVQDRKQVVAALVAERERFVANPSMA